ncbi:hypothetical protein, partial [uncultured Ruminococcus sp.]|uniref:hypothetical protein n=1 Tax=uncultured Ruminococcus sp. TaxID=165186 RepID=UPI0025CFAA65
ILNVVYYKDPMAACTIGSVCYPNICPASFSFCFGGKFLSNSSTSSAGRSCQSAEITIMITRYSVFVNTNLDKSSAQWYTVRIKCEV